jgi:hypothetical protein
MKDKIKKIINSKNAPFIILFLVMLIINVFKSTVSNDDAWFAQIINGNINPNIKNMNEYMHWRYETWSSRLIIEFFLIEFSMNFNVLWKIFDAFIYCLLAYGIYRVFCSKDMQKKAEIRWLIVFLVFFIPQELLSSAGWISTTLNYTWVVAFGIISLIPIRKCLDDEKFKWFEIIVYLLSIIYATNSEQMCLVLFTIYLIFTVYLIVKKKIKPIVGICFLISVCSLIYILTCPGNSERTSTEIEVYFKEFVNLTFIQKLEISLTSTMQYYIYNFNIIYVICTLILMIRVYQKYKENLLCKVIATVPVLFGVAFNIGSEITKSLFPNIYNLMMEQNFTSHLYVSLENSNIIKYYVPVIISAINLGLLFLTVYLAFRNSKKLIIGILCIGAGICTRLLMGFVPSVFVSGNRTQIIFLVSMIIISVLILDDKKEETLKNYINILIPFVLLTAIDYLSFAHSIR